MNITTKSRYAVRALVELAQLSDGRPVALNEIARSRQVPARFLEQLFGSLRRAGMLRSHRGVTGGFSFARPPEDISVLDVVRVLDGPLGTSLCTVSDGCAQRPNCAVSDVWMQVKLATEHVLDSVTIRQLASREIEGRMGPRPGGAHAPGESAGGVESGLAT